MSQVQRKSQLFVSFVILTYYFHCVQCGWRAIISNPKSSIISPQDTDTGKFRNLQDAPNSDHIKSGLSDSDRSGQLLLLNTAPTGTGLLDQAEQAIFNAWTQYGWLVLQMIAFWGVLIIKACIVWIIWWWFYYGKNGGLYGSEGYANGLVIPDMSYLNFKNKNKGPSSSYGYSPYGKIDNQNTGFMNFVFGAIDTLTQKFG